MPTGIALIAHDSKKDDMVAFLRHYRDLFARYDLIATGTTGQRIQQGTGLTVNCMASGPLGGDAQIAARVVTGEITAVFFFLDPLYAQPHEPDIRALLRICEVHNVPLATNQATAVAIADHLCRSRVGHLIFNPVSGQGNPDQDLALIRRLLEPQIQLNVILTNSEEDPAEQVRAVLAEGTDLVIASGGGWHRICDRGGGARNQYSAGGDSPRHRQRLCQCPGTTDRHSIRLRNHPVRHHPRRRCHPL